MANDTKFLRLKENKWGNQMVVAQQMPGQDVLFPGATDIVCSDDGRKVISVQQSDVVVYDISSASRYKI